MLPLVQTGGGGTFGAVINTAGQGYMFSNGQVTPLNGGSNPFLGSGACQSAQSVVATQIVVPVTITITKVSINVATLKSPSTCTVGIYSADGSTKLLDSGTFDCSTTGIKTNTIGAVTLTPGVYWFAQSASDTATLRLAAFVAWSAGGSGFMGTPTALVGNAANSATSGVLPSSLGAVSASSSFNTVAAMFQP